MWYSKVYSCSQCGSPVIGYEATQVPFGNGGLVVFLCPACAKKRPNTASSPTAPSSPAGDGETETRAAGEHDG